MKKYEKPVVLVNEDLAEGVYAASGSECYKVVITGHQYPEGERLNHIFQFDGEHMADQMDGHGGSAQVLVVTFDKPVNYVSSSGAYQSGDGTTEIRVSYGYTQNPKDKIGLGDLVVTVVGNAADTALEVTSLALECNHIMNW